MGIDRGIQYERVSKARYSISPMPPTQTESSLTPRAGQAARGTGSARPAGPTSTLSAPIVIAPSRGWRSLRLSEFWDYRELLYFFVWRDIKVRYKQTAIGALWAVIQPIALMIVFSIIFGHLIHVPHGNIPYPTLVYSGLITWLLFASSLAQSSASIVMSNQLISKVYLPRILIPTAAVFANIIDVGVAFVVLIGFMLYFGLVPGIALAALPIWIVLALATALGVGLLLSALNVKYRDVGYTIPFLTQIWFFSTPVIYPLSIFPERFRILVGVNPMAGVIDGVRWSLFSSSHLHVGMVFVSIGTTLVLLATGLIYFRRTEQTFEDMM